MVTNHHHKHGKAQPLAIPINRPNDIIILTVYLHKVEEIQQCGRWKHVHMHK